MRVYPLPVRCVHAHGVMLFASVRRLDSVVLRSWCYWASRRFPHAGAERRVVSDLKKNAGEVVVAHTVVKVKMKDSGSRKLLLLCCPCHCRGGHVQLVGAGVENGLARVAWNRGSSTRTGVSLRALLTIG